MTFEFFEQRYLGGVDLRQGESEIEESGAVDFWKLLHLAGMRRPFEAKGVALKLGRIPVAFDGPGTHNFSRLLLDWCQGNKGSVRLEPEFFLELALRRAKWVFALLNFPLGNCPGAVVFVFPKRSAG